ncbi:MAG: EAL domain-containing protein [Lachnospiraceae bacterium]|nr:EAL domain-containing protein [Lachnospiraceae bacterium]
MSTNAICYIAADLNDTASLRKLQKFTTRATEKGYAVTAMWPGYSWHLKEQEWKLNFFKFFRPEDFCAVVVDCEFGFSSDILEKQAVIARKLGIPFIVLDMEVEGAYSVIYDDEDVFEQLLEHLVIKHHAKDIVFAGDVGYSNTNQKYLNIYKEFLKKENIPFDESRVCEADSFFGRDLENVVRVVKMKKPDAIVCTSPNYGVGATRILSQLGYSVPSDIVVAGMNKLQNRRTGIPDLTSGSRNITMQVNKCLEIIEKVNSGKDAERVVKVPMKLHLSESCGCSRTEEVKLDEFVRDLVLQRNLAVTQERKQNVSFGQMLETKDLTEVKEILRSILPGNSFFCVRDSFRNAVKGAGNDPTAEEKFHVYASYDPEMEGHVFDTAYLHKLCDRQRRNVAPLIIYPAYVRGEIYGFVVSDSPRFMEIQMMMGRFILALCRSLAFFQRNKEIEQSNVRLQNMNDNLRNAQIRDPMTGLFNNSGLIYELEKIKKTCIEKGERLNYVCIDLDHLSNINDIYGHNEGDCAIIDIADIIKETMLRNDICAHLGSDEFIVFFRSNEDESERSVDSFIRHLEANVADYNRSTDKEYTLNINTSSGMVVLFEDTDMSQVIDDALANKRLLKNNRRGSYISGTEELNSDEIKQQDTMKEVIDDNLFRYAYQPIVNASDGSIFAYEALMRTDTEVSISPLTLLKYATINKRLYDIERATFFNVFRDISEKKDALEDKKVFINSIPGFQIDNADFETLKKKYPGLLKNIFIEVTEQTEQNDEELRILTERSMKEGFSIAIDDFGCGYSNTSSLLRYTPNCVKIDRLLISNLHSDPRKQHFVKNIIEFAHDNNFLALAEGVETADELKASIALGVDLIQGFYLAKPNFEVLKALPDHLIKEIEYCNQKNDDQHFTKLYVVSKEREMMLTRIALELYTEILLSGQTVTLLGNNDYPAAMKIRVKDNTNSTLTINNVILDNNPGDVGIEIGENATLTLILEGENYITGNGIRVPESSVLKLQGSGNLHISSKCKTAFGIGNDLLTPFGNVIMDISGELDIDVNGEKAVGIGGNIPGAGVKLLLKGGNNRIHSQSSAFVGIGAFSGEVNADISETHFVIDYMVVNGVGIGTPAGKSNVRISNSFVEVKVGGKSITGIGSASKGDNHLEILSAQLRMDMNAPRVIMIGCPFGRSRIYIEHAKAELFGSGGKVLGIGCADMSGLLILRSVGLIIKIHSQGALPLGVRPDNQDFGTAVPEIEVISDGEPQPGPPVPDVSQLVLPPQGLEGYGPPPEFMATGTLPVEAIRAMTAMTAPAGLYPTPKDSESGEKPEKPDK